MARFSVRVELHHASAADYDRLHEELAKHGFSRQIVSDAGVAYHLPTGVYNLVGDFSDAQVVDTAFAIASMIRPCQVFVDRSASRTWRGLRIVQAVPSSPASLIDLLASKFGAPQPRR